MIKKIFNVSKKIKRELTFMKRKSDEKHETERARRLLNNLAVTIVDYCSTGYWLCIGA